jgi:ATP adenylyltransferase
MERLWTPWRLSYVTAAGQGEPAACIFCDAGREGTADAALVLVRSALSFVILNRYPYNNGHLMVVPGRHVASLTALTPDELADLMLLTRNAEAVLTEAYRPHGLNLGMNLGRPAGAGIADHVHMHVVPRWNGDTSFMSVVGNVRVLPEELSQTAERLRPIFERLAHPDRLTQPG